MADVHKPQPTTAQVARWLAARHGGAVSDLTPLSGGFWSSAFAYRVGADELVLRLSDMDEGFAIDAAAMRFSAPDLPVPVVIDTGSALGLHFAISVRHHGRFIETTSAQEADAVGGALEVLLAALRAVPATQDEAVVWYDPEASAGVTWHSWLRAGLIDDLSAHVSGWRAKLAASPRLDALFGACESRIEELLPACPERRDLIHGDLLHQNVLVAENAAEVTAIFSWKCSARGDFLFDVAWCTFWGEALYPGIAAADLWRRTVAATDLGQGDLLDAPVRHHCYELRIAAAHLGWFAWTGDDEGLAAVADAAERTLARGPLPLRRTGGPESGG
jgi:aminoglycoside phosphotransferase (APT) family kinase protein